MSERKDTNPKDAVGTGKAPLSTVPTEVIAELGLVMLEGARKYGRHNYRDAGVRASVYFDAAMRHWMRFWEGEDLDPDSGMPHLVHAMACAAVLRDSQFIGNWTDDRPPKLPDNWMVDLNDKAKAIVEKYPNPVPAHTEQLPPGIQPAKYTPVDEDEFEPTVAYRLIEIDRDRRFTDRHGKELYFDGTGWRDELREWRGLHPTVDAPYTEVIK